MAISGELYVEVDYDAHHSRKAPVTFAHMVYVFSGCQASSLAQIFKGKDRVIAMCSESQQNCYTDVGSNLGHFAFRYEGRVYDPLESTYLGFSLERGSNSNPKQIKHAFERGYMSATHNRDTRPGGPGIAESDPQLEDNNNGLSEENRDKDGDLSERTYL